MAVFDVSQVLIMLACCSDIHKSMIGVSDYEYDRGHVLSKVEQNLKVRGSRAMYNTSHDNTIGVIRYILESTTIWSSCCHCQNLYRWLQPVDIVNVFG